MKIIRLAVYCLVTGIGILCLNACTPTVGHFSSTMATDPNNTVLYVYRPAASSPGLMKPLKFDYPDVLIDGKSIGVLKYDEYIVTELTPGEHKITITGLTTAASGWADRNIEQVIPASQNKQVFMKLQVEYDIQDMSLLQPGAKYSIRLMPVDFENAQYEIRDTKSAKN